MPKAFTFPILPNRPRQRFNDSVTLPTMFQLASAKLVRLTIVPLLVLWITGAGCLLGCESNMQSAMPEAAAANSGHLTSIVSGEACASRTHDCCSKRKTVQQHVAREDNTLREAVSIPGDASSDSLQNCPLSINAYAAIAKVRFEHSHAVAVSPITVSPPLNILSNSLSASAPLAVPNRGHTYLHCCVFLI